ncbi:MAG: BamA/TamA family outer membrane protein [Deltaproteobacteria bacterium]|nr:BamA/TamA family outer membrane protein [Deltaproteobacteria bacterium]
MTIAPEDHRGRLRGLALRMVAALAALGAPSAAAEAPAPPPSTSEGARAAPERGEEESSRIVVPVVMYSPETHLGFGGFVVQFLKLGPRAPSTRPSSLAFVTLLTTRKQAIFEVHPDFELDQGRTRISGKIEAQKYPDSFWGIGARVPRDAEERYERRRFRIRGGTLHRLGGSLYAGLSSDVMLFSATYQDPTGLFATTEVPGERGGWTPGFGPVVLHDTRDSAVSARTGSLLGGTFLWFDPSLGSTLRFGKLQLDARRYFPVGASSAVALRAFGEAGIGTPPFYHLAMLGGDELLRGYFMGRYRARSLAALEGEYRFPLIWRFGGVGFAGAGAVADNPGDLPSAPVRWAVGGGLRVALSTRERLNLRLDVGVGPDTMGVYFTAREAF